MGAEADFSGWATKTNLKCTDGRVIMPRAFEHMDGVSVPLVWQHGHSNAENILGHALLEYRDEGVYAKAFFNSTAQGENARELVMHGDIKHLSIYANDLIEKNKNVIHGVIREVSLVLAGANPGAIIDYVRIMHGSDPDDFELSEEIAIIHTGLEFEHAVKKTPDSEESGPTVREVYDSLTEVQKNVVNHMIAEALETTPEAAHSGTPTEKTETKPDVKAELTHKEGTDDMSRNVFDKTADIKSGTIVPKPERHYISHDDMKGIAADAMKNGGSLREALNSYAIKHGITNLETLFPDPKSFSNTPEFNKRRTEWVPAVLNKVRRSPFSRVRSLVADLTLPEARAKGYVKGAFKKEEWIGVTQRTTGPTTVYKKQKLDRDDVVDIVDFDVIAWIKVEMRIMLEEEIARAILIGDGRSVEHEDKIKDPMAAADGTGIRSILNEHELYATTVNVNIGDANSSYNEVVESVLLAREHYKGSGNPTFYTTAQTCVKMLLSKDANGRRLYNTKQELASALMVDEIVEVEVMEDEPDLLGIIVNLTDYNVGADKGGEVNMFDDFDIDYNQLKYLIETRISGALVKIKSALIIKKTLSTNVLVDPITDPTFVESTGVVTIPTQTGVVYKNADTSATLSAGAQTALTAGSTLNVIAVAASGYYFATNADDQWTFKRPSA